MVTNYPLNPRVRAYGKARIDIAERVKNPADWEKLWVRPSNPFPFVWGKSWKDCVEYKVDDFAAEVGFFIDVLGLQVNAFDPGYAMFTSPQGDFFLAVVPVHEDDQSTPPEALRLQFMLTDILATTRELEKRGIVFDQPPQPIQPGSSLSISSFRTPNGVSIELWGIVNDATSSTNQADSLKPDEDEGEMAEDEQEELNDNDEDEDEVKLGEDEGDEEDLTFNEGEDTDEEDEDDEPLEFDEEDLFDDEDDLELDDDEFEDDEDVVA
jgi:catechol 2,3-dioxygenase-like lactoylglutathione lyase family enzyme